MHADLLRKLWVARARELVHINDVGSLPAILFVAMHKIVMPVFFLVFLLLLLFYFIAFHLIISVYNIYYIYFLSPLGSQPFDSHVSL